VRLTTIVRVSAECIHLMPVSVTSRQLR